MLQPRRNLIALEAQVKKLSRTPAGKVTEKGNAANAGDKKKGNKPYKDKRAKPEWMLVAPKEGEPQNKTVKDKPFWWCPKHNAWVRHPPSECEGKGIAKQGDRKPAGKRPAPQQAGSKALQLSKALASIVDQDKEDEE